MHLHRFQAAVAALLALLVATVASAALPDVATTDSTDSKNCPDLLRIEFALIRKPPDISYDYFYDYWLNYHGPKIVVPWALKYNFTTYTQVRLPHLAHFALRSPPSPRPLRCEGIDHVPL